MIADQMLENENQSANPPAHVKAHFDEWSIGTRKIALSATHSTSAIGEVL